MNYFFNFEKLAYLRGPKTGGCILCGLRDKNPGITDTVVYRTEHTGVSLNLYPYNPGHLLIFPLRHVEDIRQLTEEERNSLNSAAGRALDVLDSLYTPSGYNLGVNMGLEAGASIEHLHMHLIPRYPRELGIAELLGGKRVLVEDINRTRERLLEAFAGPPPAG
ncbi:MAG: HIT domain-containing protein [Spirochaetaceae bacterium]|jgi:ATP adenylyltransferase|nr:HIT domain-containing protein [Spirochaetaceae bacterium]